MKDSELALEIAKRAHQGQVDKGGHPYIEHPMAVAEGVKGEKEKTLAYLHDVAEDTPVSLESLRCLFGDEIGDALALLTHEEGVPYMEYVKRLAVNPLARAVKLADLENNMDLRRIAQVTEKDVRRLEKYRKAKEYLLSFE